MSDFIKIKLREALYSIKPQVEYNGRPFNKTFHMGHKWWLKWRDLAERKYNVTFEKAPAGQSIFVFEPDYESAIHILTYDIKTGDVHTNLSLDELSAFKTKTLMQNESIIKEDPDTIKLPKEHIYLYAHGSGAIPFGYYNPTNDPEQSDKLFIGMKNEYHSNIQGRFEYSKLNLPYIERWDWQFPGRLWPSDRIISFWHFPTTQQLTQFITDWNTDKKMNYKITIDNSWYIEMPGETQSYLVSISDYTKPKYNDWHTANSVMASNRLSNRVTEELIKYKNNIHEAVDKLQSDAIGYNIGKYIYHATPIKNLNAIKRYGLKPQDGVAINGKDFTNRLYFATSLIAAYDISVNFGSYKDDGEYVILKLDSSCLTKGYEKDPLFVHGIFVEYPINKKYIVDTIKAHDLFDKYDGDALDNLYEHKGNLLEIRTPLMNYLKEKLPNTPDYIIQDFYYKNLKNTNNNGKIVSNINYYKDINWKLEKNFHIDYNIFDNETMRRLKARAGGSVNQDNVPHDEERHKTQKELILKNGLPTEPIILQKIGDKYELVEGWHRTIQLLSLFPDGYNYPNVYIGSFTPIVSMSHTSANGTTYADYK